MFNTRSVSESSVAAQLPPIQERPVRKLKATLYSGHETTVADLEVALAGGGPGQAAVVAEAH